MSLSIEPDDDYHDSCQEVGYTRDSDHTILENLREHINFFIKNRTSLDISEELIHNASFLEKCVEGRLREKENRIANHQNVDDKHDYVIKIISFDLFLNRIFQSMAQNQNIDSTLCELKTGLDGKQVIKEGTIWHDLFQKFLEEYEGGCLHYMQDINLNSDLKIKKDSFLTKLLTENIQKETRVDLINLCTSVFEGMKNFKIDYEHEFYPNESEFESKPETETGSESEKESSDDESESETSGETSDKPSDKPSGKPSGEPSGETTHLHTRGAKDAKTHETHEIQNIKLSDIKFQTLKDLLNVGKRIAIDVYKLAHIYIKPPPNKIYDKVYRRDFDKDDNITEFYNLKNINFKDQYILNHLREMDMSNTILQAFEDLFCFYAFKCFSIKVRVFRTKYIDIFQPRHGYKDTDSNGKITLTASNNTECAYNFLIIKDEKENTYVVDYVNGRSRGFDLTIWKYEEPNTYFSHYGSIRINQHDVINKPFNNRLHTLLNAEGQVPRNLASHPCAKIIIPCVNKTYNVDNIDVPFKKKTTVIVGAGVAGLYAAYIVKKNYNDYVRVYESADRVGGLVQSERCGNTVVELGPSYHLKSHTCMKNLLQFAGVETKPFNPPTKVRVDGEETTVEELEDELFEKLDMKTFESRADNGLPWWDEMKHFCMNHYNTTSDEGQAYTVDSTGITGYQGALEKVATELKKRKVEIITNHEVTQGELTDLIKDTTISRIIIATPPHVLSKLLPCNSDASDAEDFDLTKNVPRKSIRIYAFFEKTHEVLSDIHNRYKDCHIVSMKELFRWAIVVSPQLFMISYTDADKAEKIIEMLDENKEEGLETVWKSFKKHVGIEKFSVKPKFLVRDNYASAAYHTVSKCDIKGEENPFFFDCSDIDPLKKISIVGEAYGPPKLRAWMEGACMSVKEVFKNAM